MKTSLYVTWKDGSNSNFTLKERSGHPATLMEHGKILWFIEKYSNDEWYICLDNVMAWKIHRQEDKEGDVENEVAG